MMRRVGDLEDSSNLGRTAQKLVGLAGFEPAISCTPSKRCGLAELQSDGGSHRPAEAGVVGGDRGNPK